MWKHIIPGLLCLGACAAPPTAKTMPQTADVKANQSVVMTSSGHASYYGGRRSGRTTSSGAIFDPSHMTAAHRSLPFGTKVIVTNLENSHSCNVEITDRGPARWTGRVIDVSEEAARCLEMFRAGVVPVVLQILG